MIRVLFFFLGSLLLQGQEPSWRFLEQTEIYSFLGPSQVAVSSDGNCYLLDVMEAKIHYYSFDGKPLGEIGKKGQGPGEFFRPKKIDLFGESLVVYDYRSLLEYALDGTFLKHHRPPENLTRIQRVPDGWVGFEGLTFRYNGGPTKLVLYQENFEEKTVLAQWPSEKERNSSTLIDPSGRVEYFNPVPEISKYVLNHAGTVAVVLLSGDTTLYGISLPKRAHLFEVKLDLPRIPFPEKLGLELFEREKVAENAAKMGLKAEPRFPEYFPPIAYLAVSHLDQWLIKPWRLQDFPNAAGKDFSGEALRFFNFEGQPLPASTLSYHPRILAYRNGFYFMSATLETEEQSIAIVPASLVETFLKKYPIIPKVEQ